MNEPNRRHYRQAALSIWFVCAVWLVVILAGTAHRLAGPMMPGQAPGSRIHLLEMRLWTLVWIGVFAWLGTEVWRGRLVLGAVGIFLPITFVGSTVGLALVLSGRADSTDLSLPACIAMLAGGLLTAVFLIRAAMAGEK